MYHVVYIKISIITLITLVILILIITIVIIINIHIILIGITLHYMLCGIYSYSFCVGTVGLQELCVGWLVIESLMHAVCDCVVVL